MVIQNPTKLTVKLNLWKRFHQKLRVIYKTVDDSQWMRVDWYRQNSRANVSWLTQSGWKSLYVTFPMVSKWNPRMNHLKVEAENWWVLRNVPSDERTLAMCSHFYSFSELVGPSSKRHQTVVLNRIECFHGTCISYCDFWNSLQRQCILCEGSAQTWWQRCEFVEPLNFGSCSLELETSPQGS